MTITFHEHDTYSAMIEQCGTEYRDVFIPITQSHYYGQTVLIKHNLRPRFFTLLKDTKTVGFFMISDFYSLGGFYRRTRLDRGPIWLIEPTTENIAEFMLVLRDLMPRHLFHKTIFMPEIYDQELIPLIENAKWRSVINTKPYQTCLLNLKPNTGDLRKNLKQKWRNSLNKAQKSDLTVIHDDSLKYAKEFLLYYKRDKNYDGPSSQFLNLLLKKASTENAVTFTRILQNNKVISFAVFLRHNTSATYQAAWQSNAGRSVNAGYLALWSGLQYLKENHGTAHLDLGGVNQQHAVGLTRFKEGLNGQTINLVGSYY